MKRNFFFCTVILLLLLLGLAGVTAEAASSGSCGVNLTWTLDDEGLLTITGTGAMNGYDWPSPEVYIGAPWSLGGRTAVHSLRIEEGVTSIGRYAFACCTGLTSVTFPSSMKIIGEEAFASCTSLTSVTIPEGVTSIGRQAFRNTPWLNSLMERMGDYVVANHILLLYQGKGPEATVPEGVTCIGGSAFAGCTSLTSVAIPEGVTSIGNYAFQDCTSLTSITIPPSVTDIGWSAFQGCTSLKSVTILEGVTSIGGSDFAGCTGLTSVTIPESVTSIGGGAFSGCTSLTTVDFVRAPERREIASGGSAFKDTALTDIGDGITFYYIEEDHGYQGKTEERTLAAERLKANTGNLYICIPAAENADPIPGIVLTPSALSLVVGQSAELDMTVSTEQTVEPVIAWSSSDPSVATVDEGTVTAVSEGSAVITASAEGMSADCVVAVKHNWSEWTVVTPATCTAAGEEVRSCATCKQVETREISPAGHNWGEWGAAAPGSESRTCLVCGETETRSSVISPVSITLNKKSMRMEIGKTGVIEATVLPENATDRTVSWSTSDPDVATVQDGVVTAVGEGTAAILARSGEQVAVCIVTAEKPEAAYVLGNLVIRDENGQPLAAIPAGPFLVTVPVSGRLPAESGLVFVAAYTAEGQYRGLMYVSLEKATGDAAVSITLPVENRDGDIASLKAFAVPSFSDLTPLGPASVFPAPAE